MSISTDPYRYQLDETFQYTSPHLRGIEYANRWVTIVDGVITVTRNYCWDGCTPVYFLPFIGWAGVPEGARDAAGIPQSYYATLVHDVLCQFRKEILIDKARTLKILEAMLFEGGFSPRRTKLYVAAVKMFGPQQWRLPEPL